MMENLEEFACPIDQSKMLIKGKRTKRQRAPSPYGGGCGGGSTTVASCSSIYSSSPTSSTTTHDDSTEEDEDMANCLILLAQGGGDARKVGKDGHGFKKMERIDGCSKKFMETVTSTAGKAGYYVYECKTCNRIFPSFQALGGHRASHKKPKIINLVEDEKNQEILVPSPRDEIVLDKIISPSSSLPELSRSVQTLHSNKKATKTHECSICGVKFTSGQALGGHMRRHRSGPPPAGAAAAAAQISLSSTVDHSSSTSTSSGLPPEAAHDVQKPRNIQALDLNLPAPEEDQRDIKFKFVTPQKSLVLSCPALVDCHY